MNPSIRGFPAVVLSLWLSSSALAGAIEWHFFPAGRNAHKELAQAPASFDKANWLSVALPHSFDRIQPQDGVFGWYACGVDVPAAFQGWDMILDLGLIDDADITYLNGAEVGKMGSFALEASSAWNQDRLYRVPASMIHYGKINVLAVQVKDFSGIGGMLGQPYVGVALPAQGRCRFVAGDAPAEKMAPADSNETGSAQVALPDLEWDKRQPGNPSFGWYRVHFDLSKEMFGCDLFLDLGRVYDVAACYLNDQLVGQIGSFPPKTFLQTGGRFRCVLPASMLQAGDNVLAVRLYNESELGGLLGVPSLNLADSTLLGETRTVGELLQTLASPMQPAKVDARRLLTLCDYLIHSGQSGSVLGLCQRIMTDKTSDAESVRRARQLQVYALWLNGQGEEAWREFQALDFSQPVAYEVTTAMAQYCRRNEPPAQGVLYLGRDTQTQGDSDFRYGLQEAVLCAMNAPFDAAHGIGPGLKFRLATGSKDEVPRAWLGAPESADKRALFCPATGKRRYASWDDRGEIRPFDDNGPDLLLSLSVPAGPHLLSFYLVDWDWFAGAHPRLQSILLLDEATKPLTVVSTSKFGGGQYERFLVEGPKDLTVRFAKHRSPCAVLSGVFLDTVQPLQPLPLAGAPSVPVESALETRYAELVKTSNQSIISLLRQTQLQEFENEALDLTKAHRQSRLYWLLAECRRVRADFVGSQEALNQYLSTVAEEVPKERLALDLREVARRLERQRYRPEAILAAVRAAALAQKGSEMAAFETVIKELQLEVLRRLSGRWLALFPLPRPDNGKKNAGGTPR